MAVKKPVVSDADKSLVLRALDCAMHPESGLEATQVGWKCNQSGTDWANRVLEALILENKVVFSTITNLDNSPFPFKIWRLP
jgi:hypothetical protein